MLGITGESDYSALRKEHLGNGDWVRVKDLLDMVANRATLIARQLAVPGQETAHYNLLRGRIQELQDIETQLNERHDRIDD
jgi:hypothetical protein